MRCPKCRKEIPFEATNHQSCGWSVASRNPDEDMGLFCERCGNAAAKLCRWAEGRGMNLCVACDVALIQSEAPDVSAQLPPPEKRTARRAAALALAHLPDPVEHWRAVLRTPGLPE